MRWPIMHQNMMRLLQNIGEKFSLLWFTTPDNTSNQGAEGAAGPDHRLLLLRESYWRKIETWKFQRRCPGHQPRGWKHNEAPRTRNPGELTLSVLLRIGKSPWESLVSSGVAPGWSALPGSWARTHSPSECLIHRWLILSQWMSHHFFLSLTFDPTIICHRILKCWIMIDFEDLILFLYLIWKNYSTKTQIQWLFVMQNLVIFPNYVYYNFLSLLGNHHCPLPLFTFLH